MICFTIMMTIYTLILRYFRKKKLFNFFYKFIILFFFNQESTKIMIFIIIKNIKNVITKLRINKLNLE